MPGCSPAERAARQELAAALTAEGYAATVHPVATGTQLCQHHCPVQAVAQQFPQLCDAETAALSQLLDTHVQRLATIAHGDGVCTTHVPAPHRKHQPRNHRANPTERCLHDGLKPEIEGLQGLDGPENYKFGWSDDDSYALHVERGLSETVVRNISALKSEPQWMLDLRLKGLKLFEKKPMPTWGSDLSGIDFDNIKYFVRSTEKMAATWDDLPADIKATYDKLGIPEAEKQRLVSGVAAQYESEVVYHQIREDLEQQGVIFVDTDTALREHEELIPRVLHHRHPDR